LNSTGAAIIIPTINRSEFVVRQLNYYANLGYRHTVYVGDSSTADHVERIKEAIRRYEGRLRTVYLHLPGANDYQAINKLLEQVQERYVALSGDDDFLVPASLDQCSQFLDTNPDYHSAHGVGLLFSVSSDGAHGKVIDSGHYRQGQVEQGSACPRLIDFLRGYWSMAFSVQRTTTYREAAAKGSMIPDPSFPELLTGCLSVIRGQAKELDCLYLLRQHHSRRYGVALPDVFDWLTGPEWQASYQLFHERLSEEVAKQDGISIEDAGQVVTRAFQSYLSNSLSRKWAQRNAQRGEVAEVSGWRGTVSRVPGLRKAWQGTRSFLPGEKTQLARPALLRPFSRYHSDFMPVYRAVAQNG
jgi:glycosyltransferase domain-containing protein